MTDRNRLVLNASLDYLTARGIILVKRWAERPHAALANELALTDEERAEAIEMADDMEQQFKGMLPDWRP